MPDYPDFYQPERVGQLGEARTSQAVAEGLTRGGRPAADDRERSLLLLVDPQVDFVHEDGALSVPGAVADTRRTIEWLFDRLESITSIAASLDSHLPRQIFYPTWWVDPAGAHPEPFSLITIEAVETGRWIPLFEPEWSAYYVSELQKTARKTLMIWPFHTMIGTPGHAIDPALSEAISYHAAARSSQPRYVIKGTLPSTEYYSLLEPEVKVEHQVEGQLNRDLLDWITAFDRVFVAGQAKSHCVLETLNSIADHRPEQLGKLHLLTDCTSSVLHPEIDFDSIAQEALAALSDRGLVMQDSTLPS